MTTPTIPQQQFFHELYTVERPKDFRDSWFAESLPTYPPVEFEIRNHALYDCVEIAPGETIDGRLHLFSRGIGQTIPRHTEPDGSSAVVKWEHTNMVRANQLPQPEHLLIQGVYFLFPDVSDNIEAAGFAERHLAELVINHRIEWELPMFCASFRGSMFQLFDVPGVRLNTMPVLNQSIERNKLIRPNVEFSLNLTNEQPTFTNDNPKPITFYAILDGVGAFERTSRLERTSRAQ